MGLVSFRVNDDLKRRMDKLRHVNWSEVLRRHVSQVVEEEERRLLSKKDFSRIATACEDIDDLRTRSPEDWNGSEVVIAWRKLRR